MIAYRAAVLTSLWLAALAVPAAAQQPTPEQQSAIRQNCRSDFMTNCSGVQPGGREALQCLQSNAAKLSSACRGAIAAISPPAAPAAAAPAQAAPTQPAPAPAAAAPPPAPAAAAAPAAPTPAQRSAIQQACRSDFMANCSGVQPGGAAALQCLQRNAAKLSPACQGAVAAISPGGAPAAAAPAPAVAPATAAAPPPAAAAPTPAQRSAIQQACRSDFMRNCRGVQPGGAEALQCLQRNSAQLSPACQGAVAAIAGGGAAPAAAAAAPPVAAVAPAPMPMLPPRVQLMVVRTCQPDLQVVCSGIPPGGGRLIACLAQNEAQVSPPCRQALAQARRF